MLVTAECGQIFGIMRLRVNTNHVAARSNNQNEKTYIGDVPSQIEGIYVVDESVTITQGKTNKMTTIKKDAKHQTSKGAG